MWTVIDTGLASATLFTASLASDSSAAEGVDASGLSLSAGRRWGEGARGGNRGGVLTHMVIRDQAGTTLCLWQVRRRYEVSSTRHSGWDSASQPAFFLGRDHRHDENKIGECVILGAHHNVCSHLSKICLQGVVDAVVMQSWRVVSSRYI